MRRSSVVRTGTPAPVRTPNGDLRALEPGALRSVRVREDRLRTHEAFTLELLRKNQPKPLNFFNGPAKG